MAAVMQALRLRLAGTITSFRHPLFPHGQQITYPCPPPATLYGLVCSALGEVVPPDAFRLAYEFTTEGKTTDYEHVYLIGAPSQAVKLSPFERELLTQPRLTLYLDQPSWLPSLRSPRYVLTLGRSQDLMTLLEAQVVELERAASGYMRDALLPLPVPSGVQQYTTWQMPRYVDPQRQAQWLPYAHVKTPHVVAEECWVDPAQPRWRGQPRAIWWMSLV